MVSYSIVAFKWTIMFGQDKKANSSQTQNYLVEESENIISCSFLVIFHKASVTALGFSVPFV